MAFLTVFPTPLTPEKYFSYFFQDYVKIILRRRNSIKLKFMDAGLSFLTSIILFFNNKNFGYCYSFALAV
jgi:hypothetical protein